MSRAEARGIDGGAERREAKSKKGKKGKRKHKTEEEEEEPRREGSGETMTEALLTAKVVS